MEVDVIYNEDCLVGMKKIPDNSVDLIVTDCPYKIVSGGCSNKAVTINACGGMLNKHEGDNIDLVKQGKIFKHNDISFDAWLPDVYRILKMQTHCYIMVNGRNLAELLACCEKVGFQYQNLLVWNKGTATPNRWYMNSGEFILMLRKGKAKNINNLGSKTVIDISNIKRGTKLHPTEKPIELMQILIENSSEENDIVIDPFFGAGATLIAAVKTKRHYIGFELDDEYFDITCQRLDEVEERTGEGG